MMVLAVTYPDFLWADRYIHQTHESVTMVVVKMHSVALSVLRYLCKLFFILGDSF